MHLHFWQNDRGLLRADAVTQSWNGHRIGSAQKFNSGEENSSIAPAGDRICDLSIQSLALCHLTSPDTPEISLSPP